MANDSRGGNLKYLRESNMNKVLRVLVREGQTSRNVVTKKLQLSKMTISNLINKLIEADYLEETKPIEKRQKASAGPKPMAIRIKAGRIMAIGIHIENEEVIVQLADITSGCIDSITTDLKDAESNLKALNHLKDTVQTLIDRNTQYVPHIIGIGVSYYGTLDSNRGILLFKLCDKETVNLNVKQSLEKAFGLPVVIGSQMQGMVLAEMIYGIATNKSNFIYVGLNNNIKSALVVDHVIYSGACGAGGHLGHMTINYDGELCRCGKRGCYNLYASTEVLLQKSGCETFDQFIKKAKEKEPKTLRAIEDFIHATAIAFGNIVNMYEPECIIFGLDASKLPTFVMKQIEKLTNERSIQRKLHYTKVLQAKLGDHNQKVGAAALVFHHLLNGNITLGE